MQTLKVGSVSQVFPEHLTLAAEMIAKNMDWHPDAKFPLARPGDDLALVAYPDGIWIAETHGECNMNKFTKLELVTKDTWAHP